MLTATNSLELCIKRTVLSHYSSFFSIQHESLLGVKKRYRMIDLLWERHMFYVLEPSWLPLKQTKGSSWQFDHSFSSSERRYNVSYSKLLSRRAPYQATGNFNPFLLALSKESPAIQALPTHSSDSFSPLIDCYPNIPQIAPSFVSGR